MVVLLFQMVDTGNGIDLIEWGLIAAAVTAIITLMGLAYNKGIKPVVKASKAFNQRWDDAGTIKDINDKLVKIVEEIKPNNGDQRTLSDRLDDIKRMAFDAREVAKSTQDEFMRYQRDELLERRERIKAADLSKKEVSERLGRVEQVQVDTMNRQTAFSTRQTRMEALLSAILRKLEMNESDI